MDFTSIWSILKGITDESPSKFQKNESLKKIGSLSQFGKQNYEVF